MIPAYKKQVRVYKYLALFSVTVAIVTLVCLSYITHPDYYTFLFNTYLAQEVIELVEDPVVEILVEPNTIPIQPTPFPQPTRIVGTSVTISASNGIGSGVVISNNILLTVDHVVGSQEIILVDIGRYDRYWVSAKVVGRLSGTGEDIVVLQLLDGKKFDNTTYFNIGTGVRLPRWIVTPKGVFDFNPGAIVPGDSGGAILNVDGELIGLVSGYMNRDRTNVVTLFD